VALPVLNIQEEFSLANGTLKTDLTGATLHLYTSVNPPLSRDSVIADFSEPTYTGYTAPTLPTPSGPYLDINGDYMLVLASENFVGPTAGGGPMIAGCFVQSAATGTPLIFGAEFDNVVNLLDDLHVLVITGQLGPIGNGWVSTEGSTLP
jgi:hypothetical protein